MTDEDIIVSVLLGLPSNYTTMKTIIRAKPTPISLQELRSLLLIAEAELDEIDKSISLPRYASAPTLVTNDKYDANATMPMMPTSSVASSIGYTVQSMSNLGYTMSDAHKAPAVSNGICYATASIPKRDFIYAANTVLNNESQGDFVQQFSSPSQSADVLHQHFGHSQQHLNHCRNSTTDSFVTGLYTQPNTDFTQQHSGYSMHNSNHDSSGGFVPNHNTASQPLYFTNTSSPIAVTPSLATCGRISQVHDGCFPQTSSFLQQRGFSQPFASCTSTTKQNVYGCFPQSTGFIAQSEGIQRSYGNEIGNGVQGYNGSHQLHNNSQNARGSGSHGDIVDVNNRTEQHAEALVCSSRDHGDYEKDGPLPMGTHDNNLVGSSFKAKMSSTESNKDVVEDHMNNGSYQGIQQVQQKIQQTNAFQQNNGSQHNGGFMKQQPNRSGYSAQRCYHRNSQPLNIALSSYVECQLCRRPGHIAKICRYKQWPSNSSQNTQLSSYTSMPLIPPG
ncbi:uncharacterized protein LOC133726694 [Rosa rugosa]|uniref:uncharacterized protein LOC133726694 n=1 Tax=Rosa rugosa TaxID=74645 RepID=UPI002B4139C4|nr:uncharacterized protein LOC133726694 [Rosa rugosa]XP_062010275.1 uncharacterized protein LOC133726694 [Rosa rugosa]